MSTTTTINPHPSSSALSAHLPHKNPSITMTPHSNSASPESTSLRQSSPSPNQRIRPQNRRVTSNISDFGIPKTYDIEQHRKLPYFLRMTGSITPRMIVPLVCVAIWSTIITCISQFKYQLIVSDVLLTVLGFVVGLGISFRTSSAYERYIEGRKYWAQLIQTSRDLSRHIWIHAQERHSQDPELGKADLLAKITALNLINAFAVSLKHRLRFEPYTYYDDLAPFVSNLSTFAGSLPTPPPIPEKSRLKRYGQTLALEFLESDPRKHLKRADRAGHQRGNLPLEILHHLSAYAESLFDNGTLTNGTHQASLMANLSSLNEVLSGTERVVNTPLPIAYSIAISQITWVYVLALPFQLWDSLHWVTIPGTVVGAYIILGIAAIGREIENPFGEDENDLPLEHYCGQIADEINVVSAKEAPNVRAFVDKDEQSRKLLGAWEGKSVADIRARLRLRAKAKTATGGNLSMATAEKATGHDAV